MNVLQYIYGYSETKNMHSLSRPKNLRELGPVVEDMCSVNLSWNDGILLTSEERVVFPDFDVVRRTESEQSYEHDSS